MSIQRYQWVALCLSQKKDMNTCSLIVISDEEDIIKGWEDSISNLPKKVKGELLIIDGGPVVQKGGTYDNDNVCLCFIYIFDG